MSNVTKHVYPNVGLSGCSQAIFINVYKPNKILFLFNDYDLVLYKLL